MRHERTRIQERRTGNSLLFLLVMVLMVLVLIPRSSAEESFSLQNARVVDAPEFTYRVVKVIFDEPRSFSTGAGMTHRLEAVKVVVRGEGFTPKATGPIVWLNGVPTLRTDVAEDGSQVEAYFLESLEELEEAASRLGRWEVLYQPHEGAPEVYRISAAESE